MRCQHLRLRPQSFFLNNKINHPFFLKKKLLSLWLLIILLRYCKSIYFQTMKPFPPSLSLRMRFHLILGNGWSVTRKLSLKAWLSPGSHFATFYVHIWVVRWTGNQEITPIITPMYPLLSLTPPLSWRALYTMIPFSSHTHIASKTRHCRWPLLVDDMLAPSTTCEGRQLYSVIQIIWMNIKQKRHTGTLHLKNNF
jgi:hypothetical protein